MRLRLRIAAGALTLAGSIALVAAPAGVAAATTAGVAAATTSAAGPTVTTTACPDGRWPASVQGQPVQFKAGARGGDYIWHDANGWHLRVTHAGTGRIVFTGTIRASAPLTEVPVKLETGDVVTLSADRMTITYRFVNYGHVDGIDFRAACAKTIAFRGSMAGVKLPTWRFWLGHYGRHPLENPFIITRVR